MTTSAVLTNALDEHQGTARTVLRENDYVIVDGRIRIMPLPDGSVEITHIALSNRRLTVQPQAGNVVVVRSEHIPQ